MALASTIIPVTSSAADEFARPFELQVETEESERVFKARYQRPDILGYQNYDDLQQMVDSTVIYRRDLGHIINYGAAMLRLYGAETAELTALDPLTQPLYDDNPYVHQVAILNYVFYDTRRGYEGQQVVPLGRRQSLHREVLQFDGVTDQQIEHFGTSHPIDVEFSSDFVTKDGTTAPAPVQKPNGLFQSEVPVYGALGVTYQADYLSYQLFYQIPHPALMAQLVEGSDSNYVFHGEIDAPPIPVIARSGNRMALLNVPREYGMIHHRSTNSELTFSGYGPLKETQRATVQKTINGAVIEQITELALQDSAGRTLNIALKDLP